MLLQFALHDHRSSFVIISLLGKQEQQGWATAAATILRGDIMRTSKLFLLAAAFVLLAGLYAGAMAQDKMDLNGSITRMPPEPIGTVVSLNAIEVTDGTLGMDNTTKKETAFGYSFLGRTTGSLPGSFTLSMNCTPSIGVPGETTEVTGGSWTLPVYMPGMKGGIAYAGSLYGTIAKGKMTWGKEGAGATVYIVMDVNGGTQSWDGAGGFVTFVGTLSINEKTQQTSLNGDMVFTLVNAIAE
jgi:hypothetical protein